jgi:hypothetical protein
MLLKETVRTIQNKQIYSVEQSAEFLYVKEGGTYSNHLALMG